MSDTKTLFKISELEELTGIPNTKIRYWTKKYKELNSQLRETPGSTHKLYHEDSIEIIITELSKVSLIEVDLMKKKSYNFFKNSLSEKSYYSDMDSVMNRVNNNIIS